jgi:hypothetical protein
MKPVPTELECDEWQWDIGALTLNLSFWPIDCWQNRWATTRINCKGIQIDMLQPPWLTVSLSRKLYDWPELAKYRAKKKAKTFS